MMTSPNGNTSRVTGTLWGEFTGDQWIPFTKASDAGLSRFLWSSPEQTVESTIETPAIWDAIQNIMQTTYLLLTPITHEPYYINTRHLNTLSVRFSAT